MTAPSLAFTTNYLDNLERVIGEVIAPGAADIDQTGTFPRAEMEALGKAGLLGLISSEEVGGMGQGHRAAALAVERVAQVCGSTAMVLCMHYAATAVIEAHGPRDVREKIAVGRPSAPSPSRRRGRAATSVHPSAPLHLCQATAW